MGRNKIHMKKTALVSINELTDKRLYKTTFKRGIAGLTGIDYAGVGGRR